MKLIKTITIALTFGLTVPAFAQDATTPDVVDTADVVVETADVVVETADVVVAEDAGSVADAADATGTADADTSDVVPAPVLDPPSKVETTEEASEAVDVLFNAAQTGQWPIFAGVLIMLLVWLADKVIKLRDKVGAAALPWVAAGLGILGSVGTSLATSEIHWGQALVQGFLAGASAVGLWELVFKHLGPKKVGPAA